MMQAGRLLRGVAAALLALGAAAPLAAEEIGEQIRVDPDRLPPPYASRAVSNVSQTVPRPADARLRLPPGFEASLFAEGLQNARELAATPDGAVLVAESRAGKLTLLRPAANGRAEASSFLTGLQTPSGMAFHGDHLYVADLRGVWRVPYRAGDRQASGSLEAVTPPGALGSGSGHRTRILAFDRDGQHFYVANGSASNIAEEAPPRATIQIFNLDGSGGRTFASGTRNPVGTQVNPATGRLWSVVNERDGLGDGLVPDYLAEMSEGAFYGWPYSYIGKNPQPGFEGRPEAARARIPDLLFRAHSAPLGLAFVTPQQWPERYRGGALVALHGSWNSASPTGYLVAFVPFRDGKPTGGYEPFATGFRLDGGNGSSGGTARVWGRPVGLAFLTDGSLMISDDAGNTVWRVRYRGE